MKVTRSITLSLTNGLVALLSAIALIGDYTAVAKIWLVMELSFFAIPLGLFGIVSLPLSVWFVVIVIWLATISAVKKYDEIDHEK